MKAESYSLVYYCIMFLLVFIIFLRTRFENIKFEKSVSYIGIVFIVVIILFIGLRPIDEEFVDMVAYAEIFERYQSGFPITSERDLLFHYFTKILADFVPIELYFTLCAFLYIFPMYLFAKKFYNNQWLIGLLFLITSFSFWSYGVNGIRNGIAGSLFILAISRDKMLWKIIWFLIAINFHKTMLLPVFAYFATLVYNKPKYFLILWCISIPLSLLAGGQFEALFAASGFADDRLSYLTTKVDSRFSSSGFRWDFLLYSATAVFAGWYYIFKKEYYDKLYYFLYNIFLLTNLFWILVIRANFSNRFAYLSWFMIGIIIIYPMLRMRIVNKQNKKIGVILMFYFMFTFFMTIILKN